MLNAKVIVLLKSFTKKEIRKFEEFLESPYHNKNSGLLILFRFLKNYYPLFNHKELTKEKIFNTLMSGKKNTNKFNDAVLRNIFSDLLYSCTDFLAYEGMKKDKFLYNEKLLSELTLKKSRSLFDKYVKVTESFLAAEGVNGEQYYYNLSALEELKLSFSQYSDDLKLYKRDHIKLSADYISYYYIIKVIKHFNYFAYQNQFNSGQRKILSEMILSAVRPDELLNYAKKISQKDFLILNVYLKMYGSIKDVSDDGIYFEFRNSLEKNLKLFSAPELYGLYTIAANICVQKIELRKEYFIKECFEIYKIMIEKKLPAEIPGYLPLTFFSAVINTGISCGELPELEKLIPLLAEKLNPDYSSIAADYYSALIYFHRKEFHRSLEIAARVDTDFINFKYLIKILIIKCHYELKNYEQIIYICDSFRHFLGKNKYVSEIYRNEFRKFITVTEQLVKYNFKKSGDTLFKIKKLIEKSNSPGKKWLTEKYNELIN
ncbi:MAG TPA: hypothetical protein PL089_00185 [Ignavibacteria bacterium]|nr:hypothetical protein [Ignavibacteria bacterium]